MPKVLLKACLLCMTGLLFNASVYKQQISENPQQSWFAQFKKLNTFSSPRVTDLNKDGVLDIVIGAGKEEFEYADTAVIALDGKNGKLLWRVPARDQVFGSAALQDITGDGIVEIFVSGRSAILMAINGSNGQILWEYFPGRDRKRAYKIGLFNFYNPQLVPDQNGDGLEDLLVANGGDVRVAPHDPNRPAGNLMVISSKDGKLLAKAPMPDKKEIYMSVVREQTGKNGQICIIFGTGGETIGGNLYKTTLQEVMRGDISKAVLLASSSTKGFIAPPVLTDITGDGISDVVANAVDGRMLAINGADYSFLWSVHISDTEAYSSIAAGYFTDDAIPDFFASYAVGVWPDLEWSKQFMVDGKTGKIAFIDSVGFRQTSSAVVADITGDGFDEAILSVNYYTENEYLQKFYRNMLLVFDFRNNQTLDFGLSDTGINSASTPWAGDLDNNGLLDIIHCSMGDSSYATAADGLKINRLATNIKLHAPLKWGAYMGSNYDGIFQGNKKTTDK